MVCPSCSSSDVKKLSLIYIDGTYEGTGVSRGIVLSDGGVGVFRGRRRTRHQSKLSKLAAPPSKRRLLKPLLYGIAGVLLSPLVRVSRHVWDALFLSYCAAVMLYLAGALLYNVFGYPKSLRHWESLFMCQRCGEIFQPQVAAASQE